MPERDGNAIPDFTGWQNQESHSTSRANSLNGQELDIYHVRRVVAGNPNSPKQVLERLAGDTLPTIRQRVAENPKTPVEILLKLMRDPDSDVRLAIAENQNTPPEILSILAGDEDLDVRYGVAENPHMPEEILLKLSDDENPYVRCRALKTLQMLAPDVQSRLKLKLEAGYGSSYRHT